MDGEQYLYDEAGRFRFAGKRLGICALCKGQDYTYSVGALAPSSRFCRACITKNGAKGLRRDANVALANAKSQVDAAKDELRELQKRYVAKFGTTFKLTLGTADTFKDRRPGPHVNLTEGMFGD